MYPIFFSVSSSDIEFSERVWQPFPDDLVYIYSQTGEDGADMWEEISLRELPLSKVFVVFWSKNYVEASGCVREILQAKELVERGSLRPLVLRIDDHPIKWNDTLEKDTQPVFDALNAMLGFRTSPVNIHEDRAIDLVQRVAETILQSDHPRMPRADLLKALRSTVQKDRFSFFPTAWISGFNGVGRETLIRDFNLSFAPNGRGIVIDVNEASLPKQTLLRIESEAFGTHPDRLATLSQQGSDDDPKRLADAIERVFDSGNYVIFRHSRIVEESVDLPEWLNDVANLLSPATRVKLFIISQLPLMPQRRAKCRDTMVPQRVPTIDEQQMMEYCYQLIGHFDKNPTRWTDEGAERIVRASGGNIGFLVSLISSASSIEDFDQIDLLIAEDQDRLTESITVYVRWAFNQLREYEDEQKTLLFLNDVSPCDIDDLAKAVNPGRPMLRVLGKLLELGLVEREDGGLYRLTPLLAHRLGRDLLKPELVQWIRGALKEFAKTPIDLEFANHEFIRIEARIQAALLSDDGELPEGVRNFVSAANWFQAGIRLYHAQRRDVAFRLLRKAYQKRSEFAQSSRIELARYFCLSATRNRKFQTALDCIKLLENVQQTKGMAAFLRADLHEYKHEFWDAIEHYERALSLNKENSNRMERTYRPLIKCILNTTKPDFIKAEGYAIENLKLRRTVFSLMSLARVYLHWKHRGKSSGREVPDDIEDCYRNALSDLENHPGVTSAHFEIYAEEAKFTGDFKTALEHMDAAVEADGRFQLRVARWQLMNEAGENIYSEQVLNELDSAKGDENLAANWVLILPELTKIYIKALKTIGLPIPRVNTFASALTSDEIGAIIARAK